MRAAIVQRTGTPVASNVAVVSDWPEPRPGPGQVLVATEASALNHLDLWVGMGLPGVDLAYPRISGSDGVGAVEAVGEGVDESWIGRRVILNAAVPVPEMPRPGAAPAVHDLLLVGEHEHGTHAEKFLAPVANVLDVGDTDAVEAAAFGLTHLTAWRMLSTRAQVKAGDTVLVTGIGGGVALAALSIARHLGCRTIVTSRSQEKLQRAADLGAGHGVHDTGDDWSKQVRALTGGRGVDVCVDSIGKAVHGSCLKSLARGGRFVSCGATSGPAPATDLARLFWNQLSVLGSTMGDMDEFRQVVALFRAGHLSPVVDSVHDAADAPAAWARLEAAEQFGKVVLRWR